MGEDLYVSEDQLRGLCRLARLPLEAGEIVRTAAELERILSYMGRLRRVNTTRVESVNEMKNIPRSDEHEISLYRGAVLAMAPETDGRYFLVPKTVETGGEQ